MPVTPAPPEHYQVSWLELASRCHMLARIIETATPSYVAVCPVPPSGFVPAAIVSGMTGLPITSHAYEDVAVVDAVVGSGRRLDDLLRHRDVPWRDQFYACWRRSTSPDRLSGAAVTVVGDPWLVLPWEGTEAPAGDAVARLMTIGGVDAADPVARRLADEAGPWVSSRLATWAADRLNAADQSGGVLLVPTDLDISITPADGVPVVVHADPVAIEKATPATWTQEEQDAAQHFGLCTACGGPRTLTETPVPGDSRVLAQLTCMRCGATDADVLAGDHV